MSALSQLYPPSPVFTEHDVDSLSGKVFIVSGGNAGIGFELVKILYSKGGKIYIACRSESNALKAIEELEALSTATTGEIKYLHLDLGDLATIKSSVETFAAQETRLDILWNNAGVAITTDDSKTAQGHELRIGTNCLGPYLFTKLLLPILQKTAKNSSSASVRVIFTSSLAVDESPEGGVCLSELEPSGHTTNQRRYYAASKAGNFILASEFDRRVRQDSIVCLTQNPGNLRTKIWDDVPFIARMIMKLTLHDPKLGAYTGLWAGLNKDITVEDGGRYVIPWGRFHPGSRKDIVQGLKRKEEGGTGVAAEFWDWCELQTSQFS